VSLFLKNNEIDWEYGRLQIVWK